MENTPLALSIISQKVHYAKGYLNLLALRFSGRPKFYPHKQGTFSFATPDFPVLLSNCS